MEGISHLSGSGSDLLQRRQVRSLSDGAPSATPPTSPTSVSKDPRVAHPPPRTVLGFLLYRPWATLAVIVRRT